MDNISRRIEDIKVYFWDYNTVELFLLGCAIFICVAGVMFQSGKNCQNNSIDWYFVFLKFSKIDTFESRTDLSTHLEVLAVITLMGL